MATAMARLASSSKMSWRTAEVVQPVCYAVDGTACLQLLDNPAMISTVLTGAHPAATALLPALMWTC
jgi:hypothetical protein